HVGHRKFEYCAAFLVCEVQVGIHGGVRGREERTACLDVEVWTTRTVALEDGIHYAQALFIRFEQHGAAPVAEYDASGTVLIIDDRRHFVAPYHQYLFVRTRFDELCAGGKPIDKARAGGL